MTEVSPLFVSIYVRQRWYAQPFMAAAWLAWLPIYAAISVFCPQRLEALYDGYFQRCAAVLQKYCVRVTYDYDTSIPADAEEI
jgi:hypothetical protein